MATERTASCDSPAGCHLELAPHLPAASGSLQGLLVCVLLTLAARGLCDDPSEQQPAKEASPPPLAPAPAPAPLPDSPPGHNTRRDRPSLSSLETYALS